MLSARQLTRPNGRAHLFLNSSSSLLSSSRFGLLGLPLVSSLLQGKPPALRPFRVLLLVRTELLSWSPGLLPLKSFRWRPASRRGWQGAGEVLRPSVAVAIAAPCVFSHSRSLGQERRWCEGSQRVYLGRHAVGVCEKGALLSVLGGPPGAIRTPEIYLNRFSMWTRDNE
jgi:hypothetical protein